MKKYVSYFSLFLFVFSVHAQNDGILWKISGNGLKKPSYIFGTIHYHCHPESINKPEVIKAIKASSKVALELDLGDMDVLMAMYRNSSKPSGTSLQSILSPADYGIIDTACRYFLEDSLALFDTKTPLDLMGNLLMSEKFTGCKGLPIDFAVVQMAKKANKPILGLESFEFQDSLLKSIPLNMQVKWLLEFCRNIEKAKRELADLTNAYDLQMSKELYKLSIENSPELIYLKEALLVQRNLNWVGFLNANMATTPYFMAIGAGHLGGEEGLINLLIKLGYTLTPVKI